MAANLNPRVSVIMPVYNGERYVKEAVTSVLRQAFSDWELLIVNDASTDGTEKILETFTDPRIHILRNERNVGSVASRNRALQESSSEYVAILDADDIAAPTRLVKQIRFLDTHPDFGLVGSWTKMIDETGKPTGHTWKDTTSPEKAPIKLLFHNFLTHSSVMLRRKAIPTELYRQESIPVEDVDLYWRMIHRWKFATLPEVLVSYRSHDKGISKVYGNKRGEVMDKLTAAELGNLGITPSTEELKIHRTNYGYASSDLQQFLKTREKWLLRLHQSNQSAKIYPDKLFEEVIAEKWIETCDANARLGLKTWKIFRESPIYQKISWHSNFKKLIRLRIKCLLSKDKI